MKVISNLKTSLYRFFHEIYRYWLLSISQNFRNIIFLNAYIKAILLFSDTTLKENKKLADLVICDILGISDDLKNKEEKKELAERLREDFFSDEKIMGILVNYFLIEHFRFLTQYEARHNKIYKEKADKALSKAKSYKTTAEPISDLDVNYINKEIKKERKILKRLIRKINPIKITPLSVFLFISVISSLFLVGGFLYNRILLHFLGINSSDFFDTSDYIASSVDIVFPILLIVFFIMFFSSKQALDSRGKFDALSESLAGGQFGNKPKFRLFWASVIAVYVGVIFYAELTYNEKFIPELLIVPALVILICILFVFLEIDKYIENRFIFRTVVMSFSVFLAYLSVDISETVYEVKNGNYKSPYTVFFTEEYEEYSDHAFLLANSNYAFFLNKETKEAVVVPKTGIKAIHTK